MRSKKRGFTLIELIIAIAIIATLSAAVFVALDPAKRLADARNANRWEGAKAIADAIKLYQVDNDGTLPAGIDSQLKMLGSNISGCSAPCGGSGAGTDFSVRVSADNNDAEEQNPPNGYMYITSTDLELVKQGTTDQEVGMRFNNIPVPQGASILSATLTFTADETNSGPTNLMFYGQASDNAPAFSYSAGNITSRAKTAANVAWSSVPPWNSVGAEYQTPDLSGIIQEIVDRPGWAANNALVIIADGDGQRTAEAYNGDPNKTPLLSLAYDTTGVFTSSACLNIAPDLSVYLGNLPKDPKNGDSGKTFYAVKQDTSAGAIRVIACGAESGESISVQK